MQRTLRPAPSPVSPRADWRGEFTVVGPFSPRRFQSSKQTVHIPLEHVVRPPAPAWTHTHTSTRLFARARVRDLSEREHAPLQAGTRLSTASMHTHTRGQTTPPPGAGSQGRQAGRAPATGSEWPCTRCRRSTLPTSGPRGRKSNLETLPGAQLKHRFLCLSEPSE